jgi:hypothetical protein
MRIQSTATQVNTIRRARLTSLRLKGEVLPGAKAAGQFGGPAMVALRQSCAWLVAVGWKGEVHVKTGSPPGTDRSSGSQMAPKSRRVEVRAPIRAERQGNACGAKGGRKAEAEERGRCYKSRNRLLLGARTPAAKSARTRIGKLLACATGRQTSGGESWPPCVAACVLVERQNADWRAGCGRSACPVRREGRRKPMRRPYPLSKKACGLHRRWA